MDKYVKRSLSDDDHRRMELNWVNGWKEKLAHPQRSSTQVMKAYCAKLDILSGHLDLAMNWDCWPVDDYGNFTQGLESAQE